MPAIPSTKAASFSWPPVLVCERTGDCVVALRAAFDRGAEKMPRIIETRSPAELQSRILDRRREGRTPGMPVIELTAADPSRACAWLAWHVREGDDVPAVAVPATDAAAGAVADYEAAAREAGATLVTASIREIDAIVETYRRFVADVDRRAALPVDDRRSITARLREALPWGDRDE